MVVLLIISSLDFETDTTAIALYDVLRQSSDGGWRVILMTEAGASRCRRLSDFLELELLSYDRFYSLGHFVLGRLRSLGRGLNVGRVGCDLL